MKNVRKLKYALLANAMFSTISGLILIFFNDQLARIMAVKIPAILLFIGIGLLFFAGSIIWLAKHTAINQKRVKMIIIQDWLWVIGSLLILIFQIFGLSRVGYAMILGVAIVVGIFAFLQQRYLGLLKE